MVLLFFNTDHSIDNFDYPDGKHTWLCCCVEALLGRTAMWAVGRSVIWWRRSRVRHGTYHGATVVHSSSLGSTFSVACKLERCIFPLCASSTSNPFSDAKCQRSRIISVEKKKRKKKWMNGEEEICCERTRQATESISLLRLHRLLPGKFSLFRISDSSWEQKEITSTLL